MDIKIGEYYVNKTWRFLLPCLRGHGDIFVRKFNPVHKLAVGIHDTLCDDSKISEGRNIYLLCDKLVNEKQYYEFIEWIKYQTYYVADYCPDPDILKSRRHMIVIRVPEAFNDTYDCFLHGLYSKMYLDEEIKLLFSNPTRKKEFDILSRNPKIVEEFVNQVNEEFKANGKSKPTADDFKDAEFELPLKKVEEIFNYKDGDTIFFNVKKDKIWQ